jgi:adenylate cyclase
VYDRQPRTYDVTAVVCDIANKHDLADEESPADVSDITEKFIRHATDSLVQAGAYIEAANGEGIVAIFGFPQEDADQADKATRHALAMLASFEKQRDSGNDDAFKKFDVHIGVSSGTVIVAPVQPDGRAQLLTAGEPVELARRFCIANRFYGTRVLIGPRTFELTSKTILARPIDFLSGVDVRERHEIYEPLTLAANATAEEVARRDSFWNGVVLYREKRWGESYTQFQAARGPNDREDRPLQLYLRRIEPLALHLAMSQED